MNSIKLFAVIMIKILYLLLVDKPISQKVRFRSRVFHPHHNHPEILSVTLFNAPTDQLYNKIQKLAQFIWNNKTINIFGTDPNPWSLKKLKKPKCMG